MKTMLITGAAKGIGLVLATQFLKDGHRVIVLDQLKKPKDYPKSAQYFQCDLSRLDSLNKVIQTLKEEKTELDVLIHNAATSAGGVMSATYEAFVQVMNVNVTAPFYLTQQLLPQLKQGASVLFIASTRAHQAQKDGEAYSASKGAVLSLMQALAVSLGDKVRINAITPGWINTTEDTFSEANHKQHPTGRIGHPMDIYHAVVFLTDVKQRFVHGANLVMDGGMSKQMIYHGDEGWSYDPNR